MMTVIELSTDRLRLRWIKNSDLNSIHVLHSVPSTDEFNTLGIPESIEVTKEIVDNWLVLHRKETFEAYTFAIELKKDGNFIGLIGIKNNKPKYRSAEIWIKLHLDYWANGYASEAVQEIVHYGFKELKLHRIEAGCAVENIGSIKVLEKNGFDLEGRKRQVLPLKNGWSDSFEYAILENDESDN